jgi:hypothetical protein
MNYINELWKKLTLWEKEQDKIVSFRIDLSNSKSIWIHDSRTMYFHGIIDKEFGFTLRLRKDKKGEDLINCKLDKKLVIETIESFIIERNLTDNVEIHMNSSETIRIE